ncbi:MAG TPA: metallophosphoesterase, partial [Chitinophagales bacterium]
MKRLFFPLFFGLLSNSIFAQNPDTSTAIKSFTSASLPKNAFVFYVIGDWGRQGEHEQKAVADAMNKCAHEVKPEFIISTGDNFYTFGVRSVDDILWKKSFEDVYNGDAIKDITWYPVLGNHDTYGKEKAEVEYSKENPHWQMPSEYYAKQLGDATFVFTNTEFLVHKKSETQWNFIDSTLATAKTKWKFVVGHHPVYSSNPMHGNTNVLIEKLKPLLEKY